MAMISLATNQTTRLVVQLLAQAHRPLFVGVTCSIPYISARGLQMHLDQLNDSPDTGISTSSRFLGDILRAQSMYLLLKMKIIGIVPESDAEAAAAMQRTNSNQANSSTQSGQPAGAQLSQVQPFQMQAQGSTGEAEDFVYKGVNCCGFFFGLRRPASHHS
ncbi:hypothetical protein BDR06DRAFT_619323 [Suillus hirtellus]|nr:hypothetical protein BDR06DRAFT_619323 [Suillus hirtellus]